MASISSPMPSSSSDESSSEVLGCERPVADGAISATTNGRLRTTTSWPSSGHGITAVPPWVNRPPQFSGTPQNELQWHGVPTWGQHGKLNQIRLYNSTLICTSTGRLG